MNNERVLLVTNVFLIACGYQLHKFNAKTRTYQLSIVAIVNLICLLLCYAICFSQHFESSSLLQMLADMSPFLHRLVRIQLLLGLKVMLLLVYEMKWVIAAARELAKHLSTAHEHMLAAKFTRHEAAAYVLLYAPMSVAFALGLYIAYEMEFKLPPIEHILVGLALFLPHYIIAGSVRYFCIANWLLQRRMQVIAGTMEQILIATPCSSGVTNVVLVPLQQLMENVKLQLSELAAKQRKLCKAVRLQLVALFVLNCNCLLAASYSLLYFEHVWYVLFSSRHKRVFYAGNVGIYVLILCDYLCLGVVQYCLASRRKKLWQLLCDCLQAGDTNWQQSTRKCLKQLRDTLRNNFKFGILAVASYRFLMLQLLVALAIAVFIVHHYLNDQINMLSERLDSDEDD